MTNTASRDRGTSGGSSIRARHGCRNWGCITTRLYSPTLGRFLQADPIGTAGGLNLYRYAGNDPINRSDPSGLYDGDIVCCNARYSFDFWWYGFGGGFNYALPSIDFGGGGGFGGGMGPGPDAQGEDTIVVSATQPKPQQRQSPLLNITLSPLNLSSVPLIAAGAAGAEVPQKTEQKPKPCISSTDGPVDFTGGGLDLVLGVGGGIGFYKFSIPSTGAEGWVASGGFLGGGGGFLGGSKGRVDNFGNFTGFGWRGDFSTPIPAVGGEVIFGDKGNLAGGAASVGAGGGYYGGRTKTRVLSSNIPVCP